MIDDFLKRAGRGESVFICEVRDALEAADSNSKVECVIGLVAGGERRWTIRLPHAESEEEAAFVREYFYANIYNLISTLGGEYMTLYVEPGDIDAEKLCGSLCDVFQTALPRSERTGYGKCLNVTDRVNEAMGRPPFRFEIVYQEGGPLYRGGGSSHYNGAPLCEGGGFGSTQGGSMCPQGGAVSTDPGANGAAPATCAAPDAVSIFRRTVGAANGAVLCGLDIGGTDIKAVGTISGSIVALKEYDWRPADMTSIGQITAPITLIVKVIRAALTLAASGRPGELCTALLRRDATDSEMLAALERAEAEFGEFILPDGIGVGFPDVVIMDKIVGGETLKTRGIRTSSPDYESEFGQLSGLNGLLLSQCKPGGIVSIANDGSLAAYTAAVELAHSDRALEVADGVFAHTLGTELGTGWIDEEGAIPQIPLEIYNCVIDMGNYPARAHHPFDLRSTLNFNTEIAGTMQKYASQSGAYRLGIEYFSAGAPELYLELLDKGLIEEKDGGIYVSLTPGDMRKPLLAHIMELADNGQPQAEQVFREIGRFMAATWRETEFILSPRASRRILYGRFVKSAKCFRLMQDGAREMLDVKFDAGDDGLAFTPLMRGLKADPAHTVAQFGQAVGAAHFVASKLVEPLS